MSPNQKPLRVIILTPTNDEYAALARFFPQHGRTDVAVTGVKTIDLAALVHPVRLSLACFGGPGIKRATARTSALLKSIRADLWILSGIGGVRYDSDCHLWDLALASGGFDYSIVERDRKGQRSSAEPIPSSPGTDELIGWLPTAQSELLERVTALLDQHGIVMPSLSKASSDQVTATDPVLHEAILESVQSHRARVASGQRQWLPMMFVSANDLHKDPDYLQSLTGHDKRLCGMEMEFAGFADVCHKAGMPFLMVRAISDVVGYRKAKEETLFAAAVAGAGVRSLVEADGFVTWLSQLTKSPMMSARPRTMGSENDDEAAKEYLRLAMLVVGLAAVFLWFGGFLSSRAWTIRMAVTFPSSVSGLAIEGVYVFTPVLLYCVSAALVVAFVLGVMTLVVWVILIAPRKVPWKQALKRSANYVLVAPLVWVNAWPALAKGVVAIVLFGVAGVFFRQVWFFALDASNPDFGCLSVWRHRWYIPATGVVWGVTLLLSYSALRKKLTPGQPVLEYAGRLLCVAAVILQLVAISLPWRLLYDQERERAIVGGVSGYVVSTDSERVYVYLPSKDETVTRAKQDPDLALTGSQGYVLENFLCRP